MSNVFVRSVTLCGALLLVACGGGAEPEVSEPPAASVIGDPLHQALERAESVQGTVDAQAAEQRRRIEEAEGN